MTQSDQDSDRIRLAEAMGWGRIHWREMIPERREWYGYLPYMSVAHVILDPFNDANDDYKVLEWMLENHETQDIESAFEHIGFGHRWAYDIGTWAKAALILATHEMTDCEVCSSPTETRDDN